MEFKDSIVKWLKTQTVLISGGSGFMGKTLIYKLLQTGCSKIYVMIRPKKGQTPEQRLDALMNEWIYDKLRAQDPTIRQKVHAIACDILELGLGLSDEDRKLIQEEVTCVFHGAASVKFDDPLREAVFNNLRPTREMIELAKGMKNLQIYQQISTAFSNIDHMSDHNMLEERLYEQKMDWKALIKFVETQPAEVINSLEQQLIGKSPNTYIFTKHLSEFVVNEAKVDIPVVIARPTIVVPSYQEPAPGWHDNLSSPLAITGACTKGILHVYIGEKEARQAYVPVDTSINLCIAAAWLAATTNNGSPNNRLTIVNSCYASFSSMELQIFGGSIVAKHPAHNALWYHDRIYYVESLYTFLLLHILLHVLPASLIDVILKRQGQKMRLQKIYRKMYNAFIALQPFVNGTQQFETTNFKIIEDAIPYTEKDLFSFDMPSMLHKTSLADYFVCVTENFRKFLGDPPKPIKEDFDRMQRLYWIDRTTSAIITLTFLWIFPYSLVLNLVNNILFGLIGISYTEYSVWSG